MTEIPEPPTQDIGRSVVRDRLFAARWPLIALALGLAVLWSTGELGGIYAATVFIIVVATAAFAPRRQMIAIDAIVSGAERRPQLENLAAKDLAEAVPDALILFERSGATVHANEAAVNAFGRFPGGLPLQRKFRAPEMQELIGELLDGRTEGGTVDYVERVPIERVYRVTAQRVRGGAELFVLVFKDQSEARRIDRMRADFIANASHELRTPLASIAGFVETLRGPARDDAKARDQFLKIMQEQTGRMARLIDDLLSLSRIEMKPLLASGSQVDLRETLESVIDSLGPTARDAAVEVVREFPKQPIVVPGSRDELFQVFENLLENACKYGQSGGRVVVSVRPPQGPADDEVAVGFQDFGPGIPAEHIPRITERFYRVDVEASRGHKGTGLGLAIVKHILTRHNARLAIKSEVGKGSEFTVYLPVKAKAP